METTEKQRKQALKDCGRDSFVRALCRDVETVLAALRPLAGSRDYGDEDIGDEIPWNPGVTYGDVRRARELLQEPPAATGEG